MMLPLEPYKQCNSDRTYSTRTKQMLDGSTKTTYISEVIASNCKIYVTTSEYNTASDACQSQFKFKEQVALGEGYPAHYGGYRC